VRGRVRAAAALLLALGAAAAPAGAAPHGADLDRFDRSMRRAALPNGITLAYTERGPRDGRPVVLIHGYTNNARNWAPLLPYLDPGLRLILVDLRGHGRSARPECCYSRINLAYDVKLLLDRLQVGRADIVGHSLGSLVAQTFAEYWPDRTRRVVLVSSTGGRRAGCEPAAGAPRFEVAAFRAAVAQLHDPIDPASAFMDGWYGSASTQDDDLMRRQRQDAARMPVRVWLAILDQTLTGLDLQATLPRLVAPTLLIWGAKDTLIAEDGRCALRAALPEARVQVYPELGHNPFWQDPAAVAAAINPFLAAAP
jgi:pimeloyl-ACP methyl ester carboxylesterase